jgi:hypothetical protein
MTFAALLVAEGGEEFPEVCRYKREERGWRKLHKEELHNLFSSPGITGMIRSGRLRWAEHGRDLKCV